MYIYQLFAYLLKEGGGDGGVVDEGAALARGSEFTAEGGEGGVVEIVFLE